MAEKDIVTKEYMSDNEVFADTFNFYFFNGEQVINPANLKDLDTNEKVVVEGLEYDLISQKFRDLLKSCIIKTDDVNSYMILGIENQTKVDYSMVARVMLYDAMQYLKQCTDKRKEKLLPVITLVVYWDCNSWKAPKSLHEMINPKYWSLVNDFKINVLDPSSIDDEDMLKLRTEAYNIYWCIKHQKDNTDDYWNSIRTNSRFDRFSGKTAYVIDKMTGTNFNESKKDGEVVMCEAWDEMMKRLEKIGIEKGIEKGIEQGIQQGIEQGIEKGIQQGIEQGIEKGKESGVLENKMNTVKKLLSKNFDWETITDITEVTKEEFDEYCKGE